MTSGTPGSIRLTLCNTEGLGHLDVDLEAFFAFSFDLAEDLLEMVETHRPKQQSAAVPTTQSKRSRI